MQIYEFETKQSERQRQRKVEEEQSARKTETREMEARRRHKREMKELGERVQAIRTSGKSTVIFGGDSCGHGGDTEVMVMIV